MLASCSRLALHEHLIGLLASCMRGRCRLACLAYAEPCSSCLPLTAHLLRPSPPPLQWHSTWRGHGPPAGRLRFHLQGSWQAQRQPRRRGAAAQTRGGRGQGGQGSGRAAGQRNCRVSGGLGLRPSSFRCIIHFMQARSKEHSLLRECLNQTTSFALSPGAKHSTSVCSSSAARCARVPVFLYPANIHHELSYASQGQSEAGKSAELAAASSQRAQAPRRSPRAPSCHCAGRDRLSSFLCCKLAPGRVAAGAAGACGRVFCAQPLRIHGTFIQGGCAAGGWGWWQQRR